MFVGRFSFVLYLPLFILDCTSGVQLVNRPLRINGRPQDSHFDRLRKGMTVDGERFQPMELTLDRQQGANAWVTLSLREGKNREIRRAMEDLGFSVNRLN